MKAATLVPETSSPVTELTEKELFRLGYNRWMEVCELFCQKLGFEIEEVKADKVDFLLRMNGEETIIGYGKFYKSWKEGITAEALAGLETCMRNRGIENGIIFTRGGFAKDALEYVKGKSFDLLTIRVLHKDIQQLDRGSIEEIAACARKIVFSAPYCPGCRKLMTHVKNQVGGFWRCSNHPNCNLTYMK